MAAEGLAEQGINLFSRNILGSTPNELQYVFFGVESVILNNSKDIFFFYIKSIIIKSGAVSPSQVLTGPTHHHWPQTGRPWQT